MDYQPQFEDIVTAVGSLRIFPDVIKEFTELLMQRYRCKHSSKDLEWMDILSGQYYDNCYNYVNFIKRVIAEQFLAKCLAVEGDSQRKELIKVLKANIRAARNPGGRLDMFLGETTGQEQVLENVSKVLEEMENMQKSEAKKAKYFRKFSEWLKGKVLEQVSTVFAKVISPLWDSIYTNATLAVKSDYDHDTLIRAVENIGKYVPEMESCIDNNRRALEALNAVLEVLEREDEVTLKKSMQRMYPIKNRVENACDDMIKILKT